MLVLLVSLSSTTSLTPPQLLLDWQQANRVAQRIYGCLDVQRIAAHITQGLVEEFGCALARIWLVEPERTHLKLMASAGLYTHTDGAFQRVPMGAFKVGKIAQNRVSFLSNNFPNEPWIKDRAWALQHGIQGFAGYPLATPETVVGVLALFSYEPLAPEFLEVLLSLCTTTTIAIGNAIQFQQAHQAWQQQQQGNFGQTLQAGTLSDLLAQILQDAPLQLLGTERPLSLACSYPLIKLTEVIQQLGCMTCGLTYAQEFVALTALTQAPQEFIAQRSVPPHPAQLEQLELICTSLGGTLETSLEPDRQILQILLKLPYEQPALSHWVRVDCQAPVLQLALTQMVRAAGCGVGLVPDQKMPLITDRSSLVSENQAVLWLQSQAKPDIKIPHGIKALLTLGITPGELRQAIQAVVSGQTWGLDEAVGTQKMLSDREQEILQYLAQGYRDRDIAGQLCISESTVKFHVNNMLAKLQVKTRLQALYEVMRHGWLELQKPKGLNHKS